jgi:hypothetical protein
MKVCVLQALVATTTLVTTADAFAVLSPSSSSTFYRTRTTMQRSALPLDQIVTDAAAVASASSSSFAWDEWMLQVQQQHAQASSSLSLASGEATGAWGAYINLFKSTLYGLHSAIDAPLRSVGWDQTWGVSIALFTGCTS